jgi:hypothetical protein
MDFVMCVFAHEANYGDTGIFFAIAFLIGRIFLSIKVTRLVKELQVFSFLTPYAKRTIK